MLLRELMGWVASYSSGDPTVPAYHGVFIAGKAPRNRKRFEKKRHNIFFSLKSILI